MKIWFTPTMDYYSSLKKNKMKFASKIDGPKKSYFEWGNPDLPHALAHGHFLSLNLQHGGWRDTGM